VCFCLMSFAVIFSIPSLLFYPVDKFLMHFNLIHRHFRLTVMMKRFIGKSILLVSGIDAVVEGLEGEIFRRSKNLAFYSHGSTMDPFIIAATCPARHSALAKSDLYLVPYFSWLMCSLGGIAIDRSNRQAAVQALQKAAQCVQIDDCVTIAPEGTRSKTGQLLEFKKGPFYLW
jgi:1-acyl-sn-glycerol-3-phosphate acyltransferase